jgi:hypothetical protein
MSKLRKSARALDPLASFDVIVTGRSFTRQTEIIAAGLDPHPHVVTADSLALVNSRRRAGGSREAQACAHRPRRSRTGDRRAGCASLARAIRYPLKGASAHRRRAAAAGPGGSAGSHTEVHAGSFKSKNNQQRR